MSPSGEERLERSSVTGTVDGLADGCSGGISVVARVGAIACVTIEAVV